MVLFFTYLVMGCQTVQVKQLLMRVIANDYELGTHAKDDSIKGNTTYVKETPRDLRWGLERTNSEYKHQPGTTERLILAQSNR